MMSVGRGSTVSHVLKATRGIRSLEGSLLLASSASALATPTLAIRKATFVTTVLVLLRVTFVRTAYLVTIETILQTHVNLASVMVDQMHPINLQMNVT